jgi:hypothetical protein
VISLPLHPDILSPHIVEELEGISFSISVKMDEEDVLLGEICLAEHEDMSDDEDKVKSWKLYSEEDLVSFVMKYYSVGCCSKNINSVNKMFLQGHQPPCTSIICTFKKSCLEVIKDRNISISHAKTELELFNCKKEENISIQWNTVLCRHSMLTPDEEKILVQMGIKFSAMGYGLDEMTLLVSSEGDGKMIQHTTLAITSRADGELFICIGRHKLL